VDPPARVELLQVGTDGSLVHVHLSNHLRERRSASFLEELKELTLPACEAHQVANRAPGDGRPMPDVHAPLRPASPEPLVCCVLSSLHCMLRILVFCPAVLPPVIQGRNRKS
jgi:hypothetical protein